MMQYSDAKVCEILNVGTNGLKKIRLILRQRGLLADRERINDERMPFFQKIVEKQQQIGGTYETAINKVLEEEERQSLLSRFQENDQTFSIDTFHQVLSRHYDNADEVSDKFFNSFVSITDILRNIGDDTSAVMLDNIQESIINNINFKFLYQQERIREN